MSEMGVEHKGDRKQYIVVMLDEERYGIDIQYVDNIVRMQRMTRVPKAQPFFYGVMNLRGEIIPVMSLRTKFGLEKDVYTHATRILIIKPEPQSSIGIIVDQVKNVVTLTDEDIDKMTGSGTDERAAFLSGVGKHPDGLISLLNLNGIIVEKERGTELG